MFAFTPSAFKSIFITSLHNVRYIVNELISTLSTDTFSIRIDSFLSCYYYPTASKWDIQSNKTGIRQS